LSGNLISLPFDWARKILPQIAITHPLRLSIGGQIIITCLAMVGLNHLRNIVPQKLTTPMLCFSAVIICAEGMWGSSATWPIPSSNAEIPDLYPSADERGILDLPAEAGTSMKTSKYFWFQTKHERPIPYTPDARLGSTRDLETFKNFIGSDGVKEEPSSISSQSQLHIRNLYSTIVLHRELETNKAVQYQKVLTEAFGEPEQKEDLLYWKLETLKEDEKAPDTTATNTPYSNKGEVTKPLVDCQNPEKAILANLEDRLSDEDKKSLTDCGELLASYCHKRCKTKEIGEKEVEYCIQTLSQFPSDEDTHTIMQIFRHDSDPIKLQTLKTLDALQGNYRPSFPKERFQRLANQQSPEVQKAMLTFIQ
jgi:hypothetical protein